MRYLGGIIHICFTGCPGSKYLQKLKKWVKTKINLRIQLFPNKLCLSTWVFTLLEQKLNVVHICKGPGLVTDICYFVFVTK